MLHLRRNLPRVVQDRLRRRHGHQAHVPGQEHGVEGIDHLLRPHHIPEADAGKTISLRKGVGEEDLGILLEQEVLGGDLGMVVQIGFVDAQGDSRLAETDQVLVVDEDARRVVGVDDEDQLGLGGDRFEHGVRVVLEILFPQRNGDHLPARQFRPRGEQLKGRCGNDKFITRLQENPHHAIDDLR